MNFLYKESKSKSFFFFFFFFGGGGGERWGRGRWTDRRTGQANLPLQLLRSWGITMNKCTSYGPDKLNL